MDEQAWKVEVEKHHRDIEMLRDCLFATDPKNDGRDLTIRAECRSLLRCVLSESLSRHISLLRRAETFAEDERRRALFASWQQ